MKQLRQGTILSKYSRKRWKKGKRGRNTGNEEDDYLGWLTKNTNYSPEKICGLLLVVLFGGHDITSRAITLLIYFLASCLKQLSNCGKSIFRLSDQSSMEQRLNSHGMISRKWNSINMLSMRHSRLGNVASFTMRKATTDVEFKDSVIPQEHYFSPFSHASFRSFPIHGP